MRAEDGVASVAVRWGHQDLPVEAARPQQGLVQLVDLVRRGEHDHHARIPLEAVQLDQELIQGLLALRAPAVSGARAVTADGVELVDEHDRAARTPRLLEEAADSRRAAPDEHLDE